MLFCIYSFPRPFEGQGQAPLNQQFRLFLPPPTGNQHQNSPELLLLNTLPLSDNHSHFWAATFDFTTFFMLPFCMGHTFFTVLLILFSLLFVIMTEFDKTKLRHTELG